jgi:diaminopimelate epimerase
MNSLKFHKMQGAGNDFVVLDNRELGLSMDEIINLTPRLCDRKFGIGADGLLELESPQIDGVDFTMVYRNADGSDAGMCGNGARCLAMFAAHHGLQNSLTFNVHDSIYHAEVDKIEQLVRVSFPDVPSPKWIEVDDYRLIQVYPSTEHVVCLVDHNTLEKEEDLVETGSRIRYSIELNPPGTNVNFISINENESIDLQTYERGVENLTLACGTGAIASAISAHFISGNGIGEYSKEINVKGGELEVQFTYDAETKTYHEVSLKGPAEFVYEGTIHI